MSFSFYASSFFAFVFFISVEATAQCPVANSCTPGNAVDYGVGCGIFNVTLNTINNTTGGVADGFKDYSCTQGTSLVFGTNYNLSIQTGPNYQEDVRIWIDYNNNGIFDPVNELAFSSDNKFVHTGVINIPSAAVLNQALRMRIASDFGSAVASPCSTSQYSQTEDYKITVLTNTSPPTTNFQSADTLTCSGTATFQDLSLNGPTSWKWYFGDTDSSSLQNPVHTYATGGYYTVTLIAKNSAGSNTKTKTNFIHFNSAVPVSSTCTPLTSNYCCGYGISNVNFNTINNSSADASEGYKDFTCTKKTTIQQGRKYTIIVSTSGANNQDTKVYIDYNNDGSFNNTDEFVFQSNNSVSPSGKIIIPASVVLNTPLRMRVMSDYTGNTYDACTYLDHGQAEDYTVTIIPNTSVPAVTFGVDTAISCNTNYVFADSSDNAPTSWTWKFGDGSTSNVQNPNHSYTTAGNYNVQLKACNSFGCDSLSKTNYITYLGQCYCAATNNYNTYTYLKNVSFGTINNNSVADANGYGNFTAVSTNVTIGSSYNISLTGSNSGYSSYYSVWIDYNKDGVFSSSEQVVTSVYAYSTITSNVTIPSTASSGSTRMRVILSYYSSSTSNPCGGNLSDGEVEDYTINIQPNTLPCVTGFSSPNIVTCAASAQFNDASQNSPTSWLWNFGDGTTSTLQSPAHTYSNYGVYTVKLKTCNSFGCDSLTKTNYINYSATCAYCTSTANVNTYVYASNVSFGTINNTSGKDANGYGNYTAQSTNVLAGNPYTFSINASAYSEYFSVWIDYNKDGVFSSSEQAIVSANGYGSYSGSITIPSSASAGATRMRVLVSYDYNQANTPCGGNLTNGEVEDYTVNIVPNTQPPVPGFSSANTVTCSSSVSFTDATTGNVTSRLWSFGDGTTSTLQSPTHTYSSYGVYTIKLKTCNSYGCDSLTKTNYINYSATCAYCTSTGNYNSGGDYINNVTFGTINNSSGVDANGYGNYTALSTNVLLGSSYTLSIGTSYSEYFSAWIDYNKDGVFSSSEQVITSAYGYGSYSASIAIPSTASAGATRMRVLLSYYSYQANTPCGGNLTYGEVEDYTVNLVPNTQPPIPAFSSANTVTCTSSVSFTDATTGAVTSRLWSFGDGTTSTLQSPTHTYSSYGNYTVKLKTCNSYGCDSITKTNYINYSATCPYCTSTANGNSAISISNVTFGTINNTSGQDPNGYGNYTALSTNVTAGSSYNLSISSSSYYEYFSAWIDYNKDGVFSSSEQVIVSANAYASYSSTIAIPSNASAGSTRMRVLVSYNSSQANTPCGGNLTYGEVEDYSVNIVPNTQPPVANFYSANAVTCASSVAFTDTSSNTVTSWLWNFGDGTTSTVQNPTHTYSSYGNYTVTLKTCNTYGCNTIIKTNYVNYSATCPYCTSTGNNNAYSDYISNVTFGTINNSSGADANGYGNYTALSTNVLMGNAYALSIGSPYSEYYSAWIDYNKDGVFSSSEQVVTSAYSYGTYSTSLSIPTSASAGATRMRVMVSYYSSQANTPCGGNLTYGEVEDYTINIVSNTQPPTSDFTSANTVTCTSGVSFTDATMGTVTSRLWSFGDGTTSTLQSPTHNYSSYGNYTVKLKTCNSYGCDSITKTNFINYSAVCPYCTANGNTYSSDYISYVGLNTINNGTSQSTNGYGNYTAISTDLTQGLSYTLYVYDGSYYGAYYNAWIDYNKDGVFSSSEQIINSYQYYYASTAFTIPGTAPAGTTRMRVILNTSNIANPCDINFDGEVEDYTINILQNTATPVANFYSASNITCISTVAFTDTSSNVVTSWLWSFGDGTTSTLQNPTHTYSSYGNYTVTLKACNSFGCNTITKTNYINYSATCGYCTSTANTNTYVYINNVAFGTINNTTGQDANGYGNYTAQSTSVTAGSTYSLSISSSYYSEYFSAWIDYNKDGVFSSSEQVMTSALAYSYYSASIVIPSSASAGATRMRVLVSYDYTQANAPCGGNITNGEVEDYTVNIVANTQPPVSYFYSANTVTCTSNVAFTDTSSNSVTSWLWSFGDGTTSTVQNPTHTYSSYGNYSVTLKTCNAYGCNTATKANYINYSAKCSYCAASGNSYSSDYISLVGFNTIYNYSGQSASGYGNYTSISTNVSQGSNYYLEVDAANSGGYYSIWIDYDQDNIFSSSEQIYNSYYQTYSVYASINIPSTAKVGTTRMRVILNTNTSPTSCATYFDGEVEDYDINIVPTYCVSSNNNSALWIDYVSIASLTNWSYMDGNGYGNYTAIVTPLSQGNSYNLNVEVGNYSSTYNNIYIASWIDFNGDGIFSNTNERFGTTLTYPNRNVNLNVIVPNSAIVGLVSMRILATTNMSNSLYACSSNMYYGEVEDYTINLSPVTGIKNVVASTNSLVVTPNPNNGIFDVNINVPDGTDMRLEIMNTLGQTIKEDLISAGNSFTKSYDLSGYASGMYYVKLVTGQDAVIIKKVITE